MAHLWEQERRCHWLDQLKSERCPLCKHFQVRASSGVTLVAAYILIPTKTATRNDRNSGLEGRVLYLDMVLHVAVPAVRFCGLPAVFQERVRPAGTLWLCKASGVI